MTETTLLRGVVGSTAYGLAREGSDVDRLGVFAAPTLEVAGLDWSSSRESHVKQGPDGDDFAEHEVGKLLKLVLKGNPTVTELLFLDRYEECNAFGAELVGRRTEFLSRNAIKNAYYGYATAQYKKFQTLGDIPKAKYARHTLRLLEQGAYALEYGRVRVKVGDPEFYFSLDDMEFDDTMALLRDRFSKFEELEQKPSALPDEPNRDAAREILADIRKAYI